MSTKKFRKDEVEAEWLTPYEETKHNTDSILQSRIRDEGDALAYFNVVPRDEDRHNPNDFIGRAVQTSTGDVYVELFSVVNWGRAFVLYPDDD
jgi:hypothetical protein